MRALLIAALLLASCARATPAPSPTPTPTPTPSAPDYATAMAKALCDRDAAYIAAHAVGRIAATEEQLAGYFATLVECSGIRYIAADPVASGTRYVFVLTENAASIPYEFTFDDALQCSDVR